jgi:hypothetical protein
LSIQIVFDVVIRNDEGLLQDDTDLLPEVSKVKTLNALAINPNVSRVGHPETLEKLEER